MLEEGFVRNGKNERIGEGNGGSFWMSKADALAKDFQVEKNDLLIRKGYCSYYGFQSKADIVETVRMFAMAVDFLKRMKTENCTAEIRKFLGDIAKDQDLFGDSDGRMKMVESIVYRLEEVLELYPWHPSRPLKELPKNIRDFYIDMAKYLLENLNSQRLEVELVPAPEPKFDSHKIRFVRQSNPEWYREIYNNNANVRRDRSCLALRRIGKMTDTAYDSWGHNDTLYRQLIHEMLINGCQIKDVSFEPNIKVRKYFMIDDLIGEDEEMTESRGEDMEKDKLNERSFFEFSRNLDDDFDPNEDVPF